MYIEAIKKDDGYFIPVKGKNEKIRVFLDEDTEGLNIVDLFKRHIGSTNVKELSKDEFRELYGEDMYRKYLLLDTESMEENWEFLVRTKVDHGDDFGEMEDAVSAWYGE